jgi:hypothetical protein
MRSRVPAPVLVLAVLAALLMGSVGSATASGLSAKAVKKIAAKVVDKQAPKLSVAHAATAGSATNATNAANAANTATLDGQPASAYTTTAYRFRLPATSAGTSRTWRFTVPPGHYDVSYAVFASLSGANTYLSCALYPGTDTTSNSEARTYGTSFASFSTATGGATLTLPTGALTMTCVGSSSFTVNPDTSTVSSVSLTQLSAVVDGTASQVTRP